MFLNDVLLDSFALPYAVESLHALKKEQPKIDKMLLSAADPLDLVGIILPGGQVAAHSSKKFSLAILADQISTSI